MIMKIVADLTFGHLSYDLYERKTGIFTYYNSTVMICVKSQIAIKQITTYPLPLLLFSS